MRYRLRMNRISNEVFLFKLRCQPLIWIGQASKYTAPEYDKYAQTMYNTKKHPYPNTPRKNHVAKVNRTNNWFDVLLIQY